MMEQFATAGITAGDQKDLLCSARTDPHADPIAENS